MTAPVAEELERDLLRGLLEELPDEEPEVEAETPVRQLVIINWSGELDKMWPKGAACGSRGGPPSPTPLFRGTGRAQPPGVKWAVIWTR